MISLMYLLMESYDKREIELFIKKGSKDKLLNKCEEIKKYLDENIVANEHDIKVFVTNKDSVFDWVNLVILYGATNITKAVSRILKQKFKTVTTDYFPILSDDINNLKQYEILELIK